MTAVGSLTPRELKALRPYLTGATRGAEWAIHCPLHDDERRSAELNVERKLWHCMGCGAGGTVKELMAQRKEWLPAPNGGLTDEQLEAAVRNGERPVGEATPTLVQIEYWKERLSGPDLRDQRAWLTREKGIGRGSMKNFQIGYDEYNKCYTIPIFDDKGGVLNVRRYDPVPPENRPKMRNVVGHGDPVLFPGYEHPLPGTRVFIGGGEWDTILTRQMGFPFWTVTASEGVWLPVFTERFVGCHVILVPDRDVHGQRAALKWTQALESHAASVSVLVLPYELVEKRGKDASDFWLDRRDQDDGGAAEWEKLCGLAQAATPDPSETSVRLFSEARSTHFINAPMALNGLTVKMRDQAIYGVPHDVQITCSAEKPCKRCPGEGGMNYSFDNDNPLLSRLVGLDEKEQHLEIKVLLGLPPRCPNLSIKTGSFHAAERMVLHERQGSADEELLVYAVSKGDRTVPSDAVLDVVGCPVFIPRQRMEKAFLAWDVQDSKSHGNRRAGNRAHLNRFRCRPGQRPLTRMAELADSMAAHATHIYGQNMMHVLMDLVWHSVPEIEIDGLVHKGCLDAMLLGYTRSGKSMAATRLAAWYGVGDVQPCDAVSLVGLTAAVETTHGARFLHPGLLPRNDRGLVVLDEFNKLPHEIVVGLSSVRSSGFVDINKAKSGRLPARVRLLMISNPVEDLSNARLAQSLTSILRLPADVARLDLAGGVSAISNLPRERASLRARSPRVYRQDYCEELVRWAWTRDADQVRFPPRASSLLGRIEKGLIAEYPGEPLLVNTPNLGIKLARIAAAMAARTFSTSHGGRVVVVTAQHLRDAARLMRRLYEDPVFGYGEINSEIKSRQSLRQTNAADAAEILNMTQEGQSLARWLLRYDKFDLYDAVRIFRPLEDAVHTMVRQDLLIPNADGKTRLLTVSPELRLALKNSGLW